LNKSTKSRVIESYRKHENDTGSAEVQVAVLTERIIQLTRHMGNNKHDFNTQRGLMKIIGKRRRLLNYLIKEDVGRYQKLIASLGLRK
jgi:small subunit ribosomal protein S15